MARMNYIDARSGPHRPSSTRPIRRKAVNLSIDSALIADAKKLGVNLSQEAEKGVADAVKSAKEQAWREEHREWIEAHNERVAREGVPFPPAWLDADDVEV